MAELTATYLNAVVNYLRGAGAPVAISAVYLDIYNGNPQNSGTSVLSAITGSATRSSITSSMGTASNGISANTILISVTSSASGPGIVSYVALFDAATSGNLIMSVALAAPLSVQLTDKVEFDIGTLEITLTS